MVHTTCSQRNTVIEIPRGLEQDEYRQRVDEKEDVVELQYHLPGPQGGLEDKTAEKRASWTNVATKLHVKIAQTDVDAPYQAVPQLHGALSF